MMTQQRLKELLEYDPETGMWRWNNPQARNKKPISEQAGTISVHGYRIITYCGVKYRASRLAWLYMTGEWPSHEIDHKDRDKANDKWENLRDLTRSDNACNRGLQSNNASGARGVHWDNTRSKWFVQVKSEGGNIFVGRFDDFDEAVTARDRVAAQYQGPLVELNQPLQEAS